MYEGMNIGGEVTWVQTIYYCLESRCECRGRLLGTTCMRLPNPSLSASPYQDELTKYDERIMHACVHMSVERESL